MQCLVVAGSQLLLACVLALLRVATKKTESHFTPVKVSTICTSSHGSAGIYMRAQSVLLVTTTKLNKVYLNNLVIIVSSNFSV